MIDFSKIVEIKANNIKPERGRILISEPLLNDYYFSRSVILLAEHNEEGSFGIIMNKPLDVSFNEVVKDFPTFGGDIFLGGPVKSDSLFYIHTLGDIVENSYEIINGLFWGGETKIIKDMIISGHIKSNQIRFFLGYSGWNPNQLEEELKRNSWVVSNTNSDFLLNVDYNLLWEKSLISLDKDYEIWTKFPKNPNFN